MAIRAVIVFFQWNVCSQKKIGNKSRTTKLTTTHFTSYRNCFDRIFKSFGTGVLNKLPTCQSNLFNFQFFLSFIIRVVGKVLLDMLYCKAYHCFTCDPADKKICNSNPTWICVWDPWLGTKLFFQVPTWQWYGIHVEGELNWVCVCVCTSPIQVSILILSQWWLKHKGKKDGWLHKEIRVNEY